MYLFKSGILAAGGGGRFTGFTGYTCKMAVTRTLP